MNRVLVVMLLVTMVACGNSGSTHHPPNPNGKGPAPLDLKSASSFAVLTKS
jgi:hypothetical protein